MKKKVDFRIDETLLGLLDQYAAALRSTRTAALERLINDHCAMDTVVYQHTLPGALAGLGLSSSRIVEKMRELAANPLRVDVQPAFPTAPEPFPAEFTQELATRRPISDDPIHQDASEQPQATDYPSVGRDHHRAEGFRGPIPKPKDAKKPNKIKQNDEFEQ